MKHDGIIPSDEADKLYSYPTLPSDSDKLLLGDGTWGDVYHHPTMTAVTGYPTANVAPNFGDKFRFMQISRDSLGHVSGMASRWVTIPSYTATDSKVGLMSTADKVKLNAYPSAPTGSSFKLAQLTLADGSTVSLLAAVGS